MNEDSSGYIPALRFHSLTRYFDAVLATTLKEEKFKSLLVKQANVQPETGCQRA